MSEQKTPREILAELAKMSDEEFSQFMAWHFDRLCKQPLPNETAQKTEQGETK